MWVITAFSASIVFCIVIGLYCRSRLILSTYSLWDLLGSSSWHPLKGEFGFLPFILGTLWITGVAVSIAVPLSILSAIYLCEYAPGYIQRWTKPLIDILAGIPSVVYGVWGLLAVVPLVRNILAPAMQTTSTGYSVLAGGIVLAVMIFPIIIHVSTEVFNSIPYELRETSWALGATKWQTVKHVILRKASPGILAAIVLGLSRALGETMAVLMVTGNVAKAPTSILSPAYALPALIANNYGEMLSIPLYDSALLLASLILLGIVLFFNFAARLILIRIERSVQ
jgi:phosphate transport system permease protein